MVFSSLIFLFGFLPLNLLLYFVIKNQTYRNVILIIFSLSFYAWGEPIWISLLIFSATIDFFHGKIIDKYRGTKLATLALISSIFVNLSLLGIFKYSGFLMSNINMVFNISLPVKEFALPIGISFYTFQTLSYTFDVYKGEVKAQQSYHKFLLFVSLFHQLVAGPIVRYKDIADEIENRTTTYDKFHYGINRFVIGLGKKVIIANTAGELSSRFLDQPFNQLSVVSSWFGISLFALQIYFDFSGYSDMAIGLGRMFGFTYKENFNFPYIAKSATDFWRRWHISLGSFFRDYVYIPLGGNKLHHLRNIIIVWFLTGLWHGAHWNFVLWGMFYGILIMVEKIFLSKWLVKLPKLLQHSYLLVITLIGWTLFYFTDLTLCLSYLKIMFGMSTQPIITATFYIQFANNIFFYIFACIVATPIMNNVLKLLITKLKHGQTVENYLIICRNIVIIVVSITLLVGETYNPFLYFRF